MLSIPVITGSPSGGTPNRRSQRHRIESLAYLDLGLGNGGFPLNLSETGMAFQGILPLEQGQIVALKLKLPGTSDTVQVSGQIIWLNELGKGGGLKFIDLPETSRILIRDWLSSQTPGETPAESLPEGLPQAGKKEFRPQVPPDFHAGSTILAAKVNSPALSKSLLVPVLSQGAASAGHKSTTSFSASGSVAQAPTQGMSGRRAWIMPFAIGVITSVALMVGVLCAYGVISIQFRVPQKGAVETSSRPITESGVASRPASPPEMKLTNESSPDPANRGLTPAPAPPKPAASGPSPAKPAVQAEPRSTKSSTPVAATAKLIEPRPTATAKPADFVPPAFAVPTTSVPGALIPAIPTGAPAPAPPTSPSTPQTHSFDAPQVITRREPVYPIGAKSAGISGTVELSFTITVEGNVRNVAVVKGNPLLARAAIDALLTWNYRPARLNGIPVEAQSTAIFNFKEN